MPRCSVPAAARPTRSGKSRRPDPHPNGGTPRRRRCRAFSLAEALVAVGVIGMAGAAILLATEAASQSSRNAVEQLVAGGLANQLIDEIMGLPYKEKGQSPQAWPLGPEAGETATPPLRRLFDDADDFANYAAQPAPDAWAIELGQGDGQGGLRHANFRTARNYFDDWAVQIRVSYADENDLSSNLPGGDTSGARAVEVIVYRVDGNSRREIVSVRRVCSYVPPLGS